MSIYSAKKKQMLKDRQLIVPLDSTMEDIFQQEFCFEPTPRMIKSADELIQNNKQNINNLMQAFHNQNFADRKAEKVYLSVERTIIKVEKNRATDSAEESKTKLKDLDVRLQMPYPMKHSDFCDHFLVFEQLYERQRIGSLDGISISSRKERTPICQVCEGDAAHWLVKDSTLSVENPSAFCDDCLGKAFYDKHGQLVNGDLNLFHIFKIN